VSPSFRKVRISTFIVIAGKGHFDIASFQSFIQHRLGSRATSSIVPEDLMDEFINRKDAIVIRDDHAPIDNLVAPVFEERFGYNRKN
jgi:hypothetical protein